MFSKFRSGPKKSKPSKKPAKRALNLEHLERRLALTSFAVLNLDDSGAGSLRQAMLDANANVGADVIDFDIAGTILLTSGDLPTLTDQVSIEGNTANSFTSAPVVEIDCNGLGGLTFDAGAADSALVSLAVVNASGNGVTLNGAGGMTISGNYFGMDLDGTTVDANTGNGLELDGSNGNTIVGNLISGNQGNGLLLDAANNNIITTNQIGTDAIGTSKRGNGQNGLYVTDGSQGNTIGEVGAGNTISGNAGHGVLIAGLATANTLGGNFIGTDVTGTLALGNSLDGVAIVSADGNVVGQTDPTSGVTYYNASLVSLQQPVSAWQGIRAGDTAGQYLISGTSGNNGLLFEGTIAGVGTSYLVNFPDAATTSVYGPDNAGNGNLNLVGSYKNSDASTADVKVNGFLFSGTTADLSNSANYQTIDHPGAEFNYVHSTMGGLVVGNYDSQPDHGLGALPLGPGHAYIYNANTQSFVTDVIYPGSSSNTAYGIWYNGGTSYTIVGGYSDVLTNNFDDQGMPIGTAYMVDYDSATGDFTNWASFNYPGGVNFVTHFDGISSVQPGVYTLNADSVQIGGGNNLVQGSFVTVTRNQDGTFGPATWVNLNYPGLDPSTTVASSNSVYGNQVVGVVFGSGSPFSFQATVNTGPQLSNVISGNGLNGIEIYGANDNTVGLNYIGTDVTGAADLGNIGNGILMMYAAQGNTIGGSGLSNTISGNDCHGILVTNGATANTVASNFIGTDATGTATIGNGIDGVAIVSASGNTVGNLNPITSIVYNTAAEASQQNPVSGWQGISESDTAGQYLMTGTSGLNGLLFDGTMAGDGTSYLVNYPNSYSTSVYGSDNLGNGNIRLVGSYRNSDYATASVAVNGFVFEGTTANLGDPDYYRTIDYPGAKYNFIHSNAGGLVVGNYDSSANVDGTDVPLGAGHAFLYDLATDTFLPDVVYPGSVNDTAYGIWYNGGTSYTIAGSYTIPSGQNQTLTNAYLVDYDSATGTYSNWTSFTDPSGTNLLTHFQGISSTEKGVYTMAADSVQAGTGVPTQGSIVTVVRNADGSFGPASWAKLNYPGLDPSDYLTSNDSVYGNQVVGIVIGGGTTFSYQATVNTGFQLSNVISGNVGSGIGLYAANDNQVAMNYIGTDVTGTVDLGNGGNGMLLMYGSANNTIGGEATGGNNPTGGNDTADIVIARPPMGNLISGNAVDGIYMTGQATGNLLVGNFIGTDASGDVALGNSGDGVALFEADGNTLLGCNFEQDPFVFYNVISGNGGNGLTVNDSDNTTIQGNFFGMGANNATRVGNAGDGVLVEGDSSHTVMGGPIPLGNVSAANGQNGVEVRDTASDFTTYNTFTGLAAFSDVTTYGNDGDGMLITTSGAGILIRTCIVTSNGGNGIELGGEASGVRVAGNLIGVYADGTTGMGNQGNGVAITGDAHDNIIGGPQPTFNVVPHNVISANTLSGVAILDNAQDNTVNFSFIGTVLNGTQALANGGDGVLVDGGESNTIGSTDSTLPTVISGNSGDGVELMNTSGNTVQGTMIGTDALGVANVGNGGSGIHILNGSNNLIGQALSVPPNSQSVSTPPSDTPAVPGNTIAFNGAAGVAIDSGLDNAIHQNSIFNVNTLGILLGQGANHNQGAPNLLSAHQLSNSVQVSGTLNYLPNSVYTLEFYASQGSGTIGRTPIGYQAVRTNAAGFAAFSFYGSKPPAGETFITATATDVDQNTSEFSNYVSSVT
jgi:parallel beta-helix repeat protein